MIVKRIGPLSFGKILGALYGIIGFIAGVLVAIATLVGTTLGAQDADFTMLVPFVGFGAIFLLPILYGVIGFLGGLLCAAIYNWLASLMGGIEIDLK